MCSQRAHGLAHELDAAPADEAAHGKARPAVEVKAAQTRDHGRDEDGGGGDHVVSRVDGGGREGLGVNLAPQAVVERRHPQLHQHRGDEHHNDGGAELGGLGVEDLLDGGAQQVEADRAHQHRDHEPRQVLVAAVPVGMLLVRGAARELEAKQAHHVARGVGEVVDGVGHDGDRAGEKPHGSLAQAERHVADDARDAGEKAVAGAHRWVGRLLRIWDERFHQPACHVRRLLTAKSEKKYTRSSCPQRGRAVVRGVWRAPGRGRAKTTRSPSPCSRRTLAPAHAPLADPRKTVLSPGGPARGRYHVCRCALRAICGQT